jgi:glycolate oxidase FAD binding subunit
VLSTRRLPQIVDHCAGDLTATVAAGMTLDSVNAVLGRSGQWLPLDPPAADRATIGGIVAVNDSGPRRHRYGTPRDLIIGVEMVRADGTVARAGGKVVKNVAGYDLARMLCGSFGSLAVMTSATFKLAPLPAASRTVVATARDGPSCARLALAIAASPAAPSAVEIESPPHRLLVRFETTEHAADQQAAGTAALCRSHGSDPAILSGDEERLLWSAHERAVWEEAPATMLIKVSVLPVDVGDLIAQAGAQVAVGRAALGVIYLRVDNRGEGEQRVHELRARAARRGGSAVVLAAPPEVQARVDRWGQIGSSLAVMRAVKARFDPHGILNPGGGPGGI